MVSSAPPAGVVVISFACKTDKRGMLMPIEQSDVPFPVQRIFIVSGGHEASLRGGHAHRTNRQLMACISGQVDVDVKTSQAEWQIRLIPDGKALLVEAGVWTAQHYRGEVDRLLVLASEPYDKNSYLT